MREQEQYAIYTERSLVGACIVAKQMARETSGLETKVMREGSTCKTQEAVYKQVGAKMEAIIR